MLPRKLHLEQVNRFHDKIEELNDLIISTTDKEVEKSYIKLFKIGNK